MTTPRRETLEKLTPVLTKRWGSPDAWKRETYEQLDGYRPVEPAQVELRRGEYREHMIELRREK